MAWPDRLAILALCCVFASSSAFACSEHRDPKQRYAFMKTHPCPATGKPRGACPGYVVDHIVPLCTGGKDRPMNMQWQTVADARAKDVLERKQCKKPR